MNSPDPVKHLPRAYPLTVFSLDEVKTELKRLQRALSLDDFTETPEIDDLEWREVMDSLALTLGCSEPGTDTLQAWAREAPDHHLAALAHGLRRALKALQYARRWKGPAHEPTEVVLLPLSYAQRLEYLMGSGQLPLAWVCRLDLLKF